MFILPTAQGSSHLGKGGSHSAPVLSFDTSSCDRVDAYGLVSQFFSV